MCLMSTLANLSERISKAQLDFGFYSWCFILTDRNVVLEYLANNIFVYLRPDHDFRFLAKRCDEVCHSFHYIFCLAKKHTLIRLLFPNRDLTSSILSGGATYRRVVFSPGKSILGISGSCPSLFGGYLNGGRPQRKTFADPCSVPSSRKRRSINTLETKSFACWNLLQIYNILQGILLLWLTTAMFFAIQS